MVTVSPASVSAFGVRARNPASYELRCGIASAQLSTDQSPLRALSGAEIAGWRDQRPTRWDHSPGKWNCTIVK